MAWDGQFGQLRCNWQQPEIPLRTVSVEILDTCGPGEEVLVVFTCYQAIDRSHE